MGDYSIISQAGQGIVNGAPTGGGTTVEDVTITGPGTTTLNPPFVATTGALLDFIITQSGTPGPVAWGSITGSAFKGNPPRIPQVANTHSVVSFVGRADGNWWVKGIPVLGVV